MPYTKIFIADPLTSVEAVIYQAVVDGRPCTECGSLLRDGADWDFALNAYGEAKWLCADHMARGVSDIALAMEAEYDEPTEWGEPDPFVPAGDAAIVEADARRGW